MGEVLSNLEAVERRSALEILNDILRVRADSLTLRWIGGAVSSGRVPVEAGAQLFQLTRDLLLAGACAALQRKRVFTKRKPNEAMCFLNSARIAPLEAGSFLVTVEVPLPPVLKGLFELEVPYERRAMALLSRAVSAAHSAASAASGTGDVAPFVEAVTHGVSANLCDSLAGMIPAATFDALEVGFAWSPTRPIDVDAVRHSIRFTPDQGEVLSAAAKLLRASEPESDFVLRGPVVNLSSTSPAEAGGEVKIAGIVGDAIRRISVSLNATDYSMALEAHKLERDVAVEGELKQVGHRFVLESPRRFSVDAGGVA
ncbi:MAG: hypothetical protein KC492_24435 [Myxococcales bacterium]|nr:hypothetical protein [Myxococcales bacterium]